MDSVRLEYLTGCKAESTVYSSLLSERQPWHCMGICVAPASPGICVAADSKICDLLGKYNGIYCGDNLTETVAGLKTYDIHLEAQTWYPENRSANQFTFAGRCSSRIAKPVRF